MDPKAYELVLEICHLGGQRYVTAIGAPSETSGEPPDQS